MRNLESWQEELKRLIKTMIGGFVFSLGLMHFSAWLFPGFKPFGISGSIWDLLQGIVLIPAALLLQRSVNVPKRPKPPLDEVMTQAIRERAVDNLIAAQREIQGGHA